MYINIVKRVNALRKHTARTSLQILMFRVWTANMRSVDATSPKRKSSNCGVFGAFLSFRVPGVIEGARPTPNLNTLSDNPFKTTP